MARVMRHEECRLDDETLNWDGVRMSTKTIDITMRYGARWLLQSRSIESTYGRNIMR